MQIEPGQELLHYRIVDKLGEGGMGAVWRATDTTLGRTVAIKVLGATVADDAERLERFEREAKALAAVPHPNIAAVYGLHQHEGLRFIAMELIDGVDLSERLARGPLTVERSLEIATQIARALEAAHERGVIHRDLKPANVVLTAQGTVKVLDFGLAKVVAPDAISGSTNPSLSPTMTSTGTVAGMILGTAAYMSPEQAKGLVADRRADVWGLGTILFEMLTGDRAFGGNTVTESLASVLKDEPDWSALPSGLPASIRRLLRRCLAKDPARRLRDVGDLLLELETDAADDEDEAVAPAAASRTGATASKLPWAIAGVATLLALALAALALIGAGSASAPAPLFASIASPVGVGFDILGDFSAPPAISPDGTRVLFGGFGNELRSIYVYSLRDGSMRAIPGTEVATYPFWSPDGTEIAFFSAGKLYRVALAGGTPLPLADAANGRGGSWGPDGTIVFSPDFRADLLAVPAAGGQIRTIATRDVELNTTFRWPSVLPDGKHVLYLAGHHVDARNFGIRIAALDGSSDREVVRGESNAVFANGHLIYVRNRRELVAQPLDVARGETTGPAQVIADSIVYDATTWFSPFTISGDGDALVLASGETFLGNQATLFDRAGNVVSTLGIRADLGDVRFSPTGDRVAMQLEGDIWIFDRSRDTRMRFTFGDFDEGAPVWSPDGKWLYYDEYNRPDSPSRIYRRLASGLGEPELILEAPPGDSVRPVSTTANGRFLIYQRGVRPFISDTAAWIVPVAGGEARKLIEIAGGTFGYSRVSPDDRWIAYSSVTGSGGEIYVQGFDAEAGVLREGRWQVTDSLGFLPAWNSDGTELYFSGADLVIRVLDVEVEPGNQPVFSQPRDLFRAYMSYGMWSWDVDPTGQLFIVASHGERREPLKLITGWSRLLETDR